MQPGSEFKYGIGQVVTVKASGKEGHITDRRPGATEPGYTVELEDGATVDAKEGELEAPSGR